MRDDNAGDPPPDPGEPSPMVPMSVVDGLLADVAAALHDRPVQSLVAAKLMIESIGATGLDPDNPLYARGMKALTDAGQLSRDVMWALTHIAPQHEHLESSIRDLFDRTAPPAGLEVTVEGIEETAPATIDLVLAAGHDVIGGVALRGGSLEAIALSQADGTVTCALVTTSPRPAPEHDPWVALARQRLAPHGGTVTQKVLGEITRTSITIG